MTGAFLTCGTARETWCQPCKAFTAQTTPLLLVTERGVETIGQRTACGVCTDPDMPEVRIGHR